MRRKRNRPARWYNKGNVRCAVGAVGVVLALLSLLNRYHNGIANVPKKNDETSLLLRNNIKAAPERLIVYDLNPSVPHPSPLDQIDVSKTFVARDTEKSIDLVHRMGLLHTGSAQFVVDADSRILLLKRGPQLKTCPNSWMMMGEHTLGKESPLETVRRGTLEELGPTVMNHVQFFKTLTENPLYYYRDHDNRIDQQAVYMWWVQLDVPGKDVSLEFDAEVANYKWLSIKDLEKRVQEEYHSIKAGGDTNMCHVTILQLFDVGIQNLKEMQNQARS